MTSSRVQQATQTGWRAEMAPLFEKLVLSEEEVNKQRSELERIKARHEEQERKETELASDNSPHPLRFFYISRALMGCPPSMLGGPPHDGGRSNPSVSSLDSVATYLCVYADVRTYQ